GHSPLHVGSRQLTSIISRGYPTRQPSLRADPDPIRTLDSEGAGASFWGAKEADVMPIPAMKGFTSLTLLPEEKVGDKITRRILVGEREMIVFWSMRAGAHAAAHSHPHEQMFWMLKGRMEFRLGDERRVCAPGDPAGSGHGGRGAGGTGSGPPCPRSLALRRECCQDRGRRRRRPTPRPAREGRMADVGTKLIFENDRVRVWEFTLAPGESIGAH